MIDTDYIPQDAPPVLKSGPLARYLRVTIKALHQWAQKGLLPAPVMGKQYHSEWDTAAVRQALRDNFETTCRPKNRQQCVA